MVQKIHPQGVIWVPSIHPHAGHLSEKNDDLAFSMKISVDSLKYNKYNLI